MASFVYLSPDYADGDEIDWCEYGGNNYGTSRVKTIGEALRLYLTEGQATEIIGIIHQPKDMDDDMFGGLDVSFHGSLLRARDKHNGDR